MAHTKVGTSTLVMGDALQNYNEWPAPTCIIADGPYGLGKYPGEPHTHDSLQEWYAPHVSAWASAAKPNTTLWFWSSEIAWATIHPILTLHGWQYEECVIWDKGISHVAGNCNSKTIRGLPVVTEVAVRYTRKVSLEGPSGEQLPIKDWVRSEWERSGLPLYMANRACGVANAATRKYLTRCHLWYFPPPDAIVRMSDFCNRHGRPTNWPYFSLDGANYVTESQWRSLRAKWNHTHGLTNVWSEPPVHGSERIKEASSKYLHATQKPIKLMRRQILASTDPEDVVWEPFGGLCSGSVAALSLNRWSFASELHRKFYDVAAKRLKKAFADLRAEQRAA